MDCFNLDVTYKCAVRFFKFEHESNNKKIEVYTVISLKGKSY